MTAETALTAVQANAVYDVLVEHAGASEGQRDMFLAVETTQHCREYRFQGSLGFGGKFHRDGWDDRWLVSAYPEDEKRWPNMQAMIDATNAALTVLRARHETPA